MVAADVLIRSALSIICSRSASARVRMAAISARRSLGGSLRRGFGLAPDLQAGERKRSEPDLDLDLDLDCEWRRHDLERCRWPRGAGSERECDRIHEWRLCDRR